MDVHGFMRELDHSAANPVQYTIRLGDDEAAVNEWIGHTVTVTFLNEKRCIVCNRKVNKLYQGGYCFPCVTSLAQTDLCIVKPHECHFHLGTCRDATFGETHCMIPHYVYLSVSSQAKVGLTRKGRQLRRWVDQGATSAVLLAQVPTRKDAGELEMEIARTMPDKTDWRKLVQGVSAKVDLMEMAETVREALSERWHPFWLSERELHTFEYPVLADRTPKAKSFSLDKTPVVSGVLIGVRGQYLLFDDGVLQMRKHAGLLCEVKVG
ncbi:MAG: DUF2797 domain-containing protein [Firmicutes bacterium]|nr:DUF2797 domain-containing protein [Bacillota bacterium]